MSCMVSKATNITAKILNISRNRPRDGWPDYLLVKHHLGCQQFPGMGGFNMSDFSPMINSQANDLHKEINAISQVTYECPSWLTWLSPFLGPLFATLIIMWCLPILARLAMQAMDSTSASVTATIFSLKNKNGVIWEAWRFLCLQISPKGTWDVKHTRLFLQRKAGITCFPPRSLGEDGINNLVTFELSVWVRPHRILPQTLIVTLFFAVNIT